MDLLNTINDSTNFPDTMEITLASGDKTTLGDLRNLPAFKGFTKYSQDRATREKELETKLQQTDQERQRIANEYAQVQAQIQTRMQQQIPQNQNDPLEIFKKDPTFGVLANMLEELKNQSADLKKQQEQLNIALWKNSHVMALKEIGAKDEEYRDPAKAMKIIEVANQRGISDLDLVYRDLTRDRDIEKARKEAEEKGMSEGMKKARAEMAMIPTGGRRYAQPGPEDPKTLDEAEEAALRDPEILEIWSRQG